jgi:hypothetical protein
MAAAHDYIDFQPEPQTPLIDIIKRIEARIIAYRVPANVENFKYSLHFQLRYLVASQCDHYNINEIKEAIAYINDIIANLPPRNRINRHLYYLVHSVSNNIENQEKKTIIETYSESVSDAIYYDIFVGMTEYALGVINALYPNFEVANLVKFWTDKRMERQYNFPIGLSDTRTFISRLKNKALINLLVNLHVHNDCMCEVHIRHRESIQRWLGITQSEINAKLEMNFSLDKIQAALEGIDDGLVNECTELIENIKDIFLRRDSILEEIKNDDS